MSDFYNKWSLLIKFRSDKILIFESNNQIYDHPKLQLSDILLFIFLVNAIIPKINFGIHDLNKLQNEKNISDNDYGIFNVGKRTGAAK